MIINEPHSNATPFSEQKKVQQQLRLKAIVLSFLVSAALMGIKFLTYRITHSSAVLSDALESIINVAATAFAILSIWMAAKPPDAEHPYGHGKIEYFSAGFEGALIIIAAIGIFLSGIEHLRNPHELPHLQEGLVILGAATVVNLLLGLFLLRIGRRTDSITLIADGQHILTDVYTSGGVLIGLALVYATGWLWLDGTVACLVGINILITGGKLVHQSYTRLMDASDPALLDRISHLLAQHRRPDWIDIHQLRAWRAGTLIHIDLHLVLPRDVSLEKAHQEAKTLERMLVEQFHGNASILVHMDACDNPQCPVCRRLTCALRQQEQDDTAAWDRRRLIQSPATQQQIKSTPKIPTKS